MSGSKTGERIMLGFFVLLLIFLASPALQAGEISIYYHGEDITEKLAPEEDGGNILVQARGLADLLDLELEWQEALETITLENSDDTLILMIGSNYYQINSRTESSGVPAQLIDETGYVPLEEVVRGFGYLTDEEEGEYYIFQPDTRIHEAYWSTEEQQLVLDMDKITPYRINPTDDSYSIEIEIDKAALADDFIDNISDRNFTLRVRESANEARLRFIISSQNPIPYRRDGGIEERAGNLVVNFLPMLVNVSWDSDDFLEIEANAGMKRPEVFLYDNPRRMVIDIPDLMLSEVDLELDDNDYVEDVRLSQFKEDPVVLRVVLELKEDSYLGIAEDVEPHKLVFYPTEENVVGNLDYRPGEISFVTSTEAKPEIFSLREPPRLVINMLNTTRDNDMASSLEIEDDMIKEIRTSRFDSQTVRLVAELKESSGYNWQSVEREDGTFLHTIQLENRLRDIAISQQAQMLGLRIQLSGEAEYEVRRFTHPYRIAVDISGMDLENRLDDFELPEPEGIIDEIRTGIIISGGERKFRIVFELNDYHSHQLLTDTPSSEIMLSLSTQEIQEFENIVVLDPGHGGFDPGAVSPNGLNESEVVLDISLRAAALLEDRGFDVIMTRNDDSFISLYERAEIANRAGAEIFVSVHSNAATRSAVGGLETYYGRGRESDSYYLARTMQNSMVNKLRLTDRGVKTDRFTVIRETEMPAVLLEIGFLSNPEEERLLGSSSFRERAAESIAEGIQKYRDSILEGEDYDAGKERIN